MGHGAARGPPAGVLHGPLGEVKVERADDGEVVQTGGAGLRICEVAPFGPTTFLVLVNARCFHSEATSGCWRVEHRLALLQVGDEQVTDRAAADAVPVDQLGRADPSLSAERTDRGWGVRSQHAHLVEQLVEAHALVLAYRPAVDGDHQFQAVPDRDVLNRAALDREVSIR